MSKKGIDIDLIYKVIYHQANQSEILELKKWIEEDEKHAQYYHRISSHLYNEISNKFECDKKQPFCKIKNFKNGKNNKQLHHVFKFVIPLTAIFVICFIIHFINQVDMVSYKPTIMSQEANDNVKIITNSGRKITLTDERDSVFIDGKRLKINTEIIDYTNGSDEIVKTTNVYNTLEVGYGKIYTIILADSTIVTLNSNSRLRYPIKFTGNEREVELIGEGYFDVKKNDDQPFVVKTGVQSIKVTGTQFNLKNYINESIITTTLVEGSVLVFQNQSNVENYSLVPNQQIIYNKTSKENLLQEVDVLDYVNWKDGWIILNNKTLEQIMRELKRIYDISYHFANPTLKNIRLRGKIHRDNSMNDILMILENTGCVSVDINNNKLTIN